MLASLIGPSRTGILLLGGLLAACSPTDPGALDTEIELLGFAQPPAGVSIDDWWEGPPRVEASGESGHVLVNGDFLLPSTTIRAEAAARLEAGVITLEVDYRLDGGAITQDQWMAEYEARVLGLSPGNYELVVKHRIDWSQHSLPLGMTEVLRTQVSVR